MTTRVTVAIAVAAVSFVAWIAWEARVQDPILDLRLFRNVRFLGAAIVTFALGGALYGSTYLFPLFLQGVSGLTPTESGSAHGAGGTRDGGAVSALRLSGRPHVHPRSRDVGPRRDGVVLLADA